MPSVCLRVVSLLLLWVLVTPAARADGNVVDGYGFELRLPAGFKQVGSSDDDEGCERAFRRRTDAGELRLTIHSSLQSSTTEADLEMELGSALDGLEYKLEGLEGEAETRPTRVTGAADAHETTFLSATRCERRLTAKRGKLLVTASLTHEAQDEQEAAFLWSGVVGSLRLEDPSSGIVRLLPYLVGALALIGIGLRIFRRSSQPAQPLRSADGFVPLAETLERAPAAPAAPYEPARLPTQVTALPRETQGSFSRAADGMPTFDAQDKARGVSEQVLRLPEPPPRRAGASPAPAEGTPPEPKRAPTLRPPTPVIRL
jgi:hypothetical protein